VTKTIHTKTEIRTDLTYARDIIRQIESAIRKDDWKEVEEASRELSGLFALIESRGRDNYEGIEDFDCKWSGEIEAIRAQQGAK
jgi:hypothetical protein